MQVQNSQLQKAKKLNADLYMALEARSNRNMHMLYLLSGTVLYCILITLTHSKTQFINHSG